MKSAVTLILSVCMVVFFHSCFGLKCYQCNSKNNYFSKCGTRFVSDNYLTQCGNDDVCIEIIIEKSTELHEYILQKSFPSVIRSCTTKDLIVTELEYIENLQKNGLKIDFKICNTDKCNDTKS